VNIVAGVLIGVVAALHLYFLVLEMFLWTKPLGRRTFGLDVESAQATKTLAANQGLYNGFLVAGLGWGLVSGDLDLRLFFLGCVVVAGVYGAATVSPRILYVQAVPAVIAAVAALLA
jgi:putative membrane protein